MSLRTRLFLLLAILAVVLAAGQWWLVRSLSADLEAELGRVAASVGRDVVSVLDLHLLGTDPGSDDELTGDTRTPGPGAPPPETGEPPAPTWVERRVVRRIEEDEGPAGTRIEERLEPPETLEDGARDVQVHWLATPGIEGTASATGGDGFAFEHRFEEDLVEETPGGERRRVHTVVHTVDLALSDDRRTLVVRGPETTRRVEIPRSGIETAIERFRSRLLWGSLGLLALGLGVVAVVAHRVTRPLSRLAAAAGRVGSGELGVTAEGTGTGEVGRTVAAFNRMSRRLRHLDTENRALAERRHLSDLGEVARGLAHGLRNPLNALGLAVDELARRSDAGERAVGGMDADAGAPDDSALDDGAAVRELAAAARRQIRRLDGALRSFLVLGAAADVEAAPVDVGAVARDVALETLQGRSANGSGVELEVRVDEAVPPLAAVEAELRAAIQVLVVNALEASPPERTVTLAVEPIVPVPGEDPPRDGAPRLRVVVEDRGPGVPEAVRERLFTPHTTTKASGTGVGLYLAHRIAVGRYGGALRLDGRPGGGTRAVLELADRLPAEHSPADRSPADRSPADRSPADRLAAASAEARRTP